MYAQVFIHGAYESDESAVVWSLLREGDFAVDVGANYGWFSLLMASRVGAKGTVLAIEPVPPMLAELKANLALNPEARVEVRPVAVGAEPGSVKLNVFEGLVHGHASVSTLGREDFISFEAPLETLDELLRDDPRSPTLIKLDVEGAERDVIAGAVELIGGQSPPMWLIEVNTQTSAAFGYRPSDLVDDLRGITPHAVYRVVGAGLAPETDVQAAPHGTSWVCVPDGHAARARALATEADGA
jgi:FkbM family methyltransferase